MVAFGGDAVSKDFVLAALAESFHNEIGRTEVHVGDPHWQQVFVSVKGFEHVVFNAVGAATFYFFVKIVFVHSGVFV